MLLIRFLVRGKKKNPKVCNKDNGCTLEHHIYLTSSAHRPPGVNKLPGTVLDHDITIVDSLGECNDNGCT